MITDREALAMISRSPKECRDWLVTRGVPATIQTARMMLARYVINQPTVPAPSPRGEEKP